MSMYYNQAQQQRGMPGQIGINPAAAAAAAQGHYMQQQQQQPQQYRNPSLNDPNAQRKRAHSSKSSRQPAPMAEDAEEPSGDELDDISARDIAMARYKRNHDYLSEIFTPYNAASIVPPPLDIAQTKEELEKQIEEHKERTSRQKTQHEAKLAKLNQDQQVFWTLFHNLNNSNSLQDIESASNALASEMGVSVQHSSLPVKVISIPGMIDQDAIDLKQQQEAAEAAEKALLEQQQKEQQEQQVETAIEANQQENMDMFFNNNQNEEEEGNSFFNEMVNTDDDPTVNEFLNTE